jgi:hypothetical protein
MSGDALGVLIQKETQVGCLLVSGALQQWTRRSADLQSALGAR